MQPWNDADTQIYESPVLIRWPLQDFWETVSGKPQFPECYRKERWFQRSIRTFPFWAVPDSFPIGCLSAVITRRFVVYYLKVFNLNYLNISSFSVYQFHNNFSEFFRVWKLSVRGWYCSLGIWIIRGFSHFNGRTAKSSHLKLVSKV